MTLVVGLTCPEGVVVASDSQISSGSTRRNGQKVWAVPDGPFIFGLSGAESTMQLLSAALKGTKFPNHAVPTVRGSLINTVTSVLKPEYDRVSSLTTNTGALPIVQTVVGAFAGGQPRLFLVDEWATTTEAQGFASIGWANPYAQHAATVFRAIRDQQLTLHQAKMLAFRIVQDAIEIAGPQVALNGPIQMATLAMNGAVVTAVELGDDDPEMVDAIEHWTKTEAARFLDHAPGGS